MTIQNNTMTDKQVCLALHKRKQTIIQNFKDNKFNEMDNMFFNHACLVLDHAVKLMSVPAEQLTEHQNINMFKPTNN